MTAEQRIARAHRAKQALEEFLTPALASIEAEYAEKMIDAAASTDPRAPDLIQRLATGVKVARRIRAQVEAFVQDGDVAAMDKAYAEKIGDMAVPDRRLVQMAARRV